MNNPAAIVKRKNLFSCMSCYDFKLKFCLYFDSLHNWTNTYACIDVYLFYYIVSILLSTVDMALSVA